MQQNHSGIQDSNPNGHIINIPTAIRKVKTSARDTSSSFENGKNRGAGRGDEATGRERGKTTKNIYKKTQNNKRQAARVSATERRVGRQMAMAMAMAIAELIRNQRLWRTWASEFPTLTGRPVCAPP